MEVAKLKGAARFEHQLNAAKAKRELEKQRLFLKELEKQWKEYRKRCWKLTEKAAHQVPNIHKRKFRKYDLDHIVSIRFCWLNSIEVEKAASLENLRIIPHRENHRKGIQLTEESIAVLRSWGFVLEEAVAGRKRKKIKIE